MLQVQSANMITKLQLKAFVFLNILLVSAAVGEKILKTEEKLAPVSTIPIPSPAIGTLRTSQDPNLGHRDSEKKKRKRKMWLIGVYTGVGLMVFVGIVIALLFMIHWRKKRLIKNGEDVEQQQQQLGLSIRTTSSFDGGEHKTRVESYTLEDLQKTTQDFCLGNLIQGSVFQGRLKGKTVAIKRVASEAIPKIETEVFLQGSNPNMIRLLGTCVMDGPDSFLVLEYASNGSLKDWIHGGLAIKSRFIASCSCFLSWKQRLRICIDVATCLQHMHQIKNPHRNIASRNIFLDESFGARLGLPRLSGGEEEKGCLTDIFAYGVVLLEVLSGKQPATTDGNKVFDEINKILQTEELKGWMDSALGESYPFDGALMLANIARSCVGQDLSSRPSAGEVVEKLLRLVEELPVGDQLNICESSCRPLVGIKLT